jgi:hypothetical protein
VLETAALHPEVASYLCTALGAIARHMGLDMPPWRDSYVADYHALAAAREREPAPES